MNIFQGKQYQRGRVVVIAILSFIVLVVVVSRLSSMERIVVRIGDRSFLAEVADTPALRERGLGSRDELLSSRGMLFLFPDMDPDRYAFWMKGMRFPLDIAWIRGGRVIFIERNIPADSDGIFRPPTEAESVLEVNASELSGVELGDPVLVSSEGDDIGFLSN
jgi:uncharacterized membrane protein (UPF0127 family)